MNIITVQQLIDSLNKGVSFVGIDIEKKIKLPGGKKNVYQDRVTKRTTKINAMLYNECKQSGYESQVKKRLQKQDGTEVDIEFGPLPWGKRVGNTPIIEHNGQYYIQTIVVNNGVNRYAVDGHVVQDLWQDGVHVLIDPLTQLATTELPKSSKPKSQHGLQDDNMVQINTIRIDNIIRLAINGNVYDQIVA